MPTCSYADAIYVVNGGQLTINNLFLTMYVGGTIVVSDGGKLILNGTTIEFNGGSSNSRAGVGIECIGTYTITGIDPITGDPIRVPLDEQFDVFPDPNVLNDNSKWEGTLNPNQSQVIIKNSTIKFAEFGVKSTYGGIVRVDESNFEDCHTAIDIGTWHSASYPQTNASYFMNSEFSWGVYHSDNKHLMKLNNVNGINIGGCTFTTNYSWPRCYRGTGIFSYLSNYAVSQGGNSFCEGTYDQINGNGSIPPISPKCLTNCMLSGATNGCIFSNLDTAISFIGDANDNDKGTLNVRFSTFTNNLWGIVAQYGRNLRIDNNEFKGNALVMNDPNLSGNSIFNYCYDTYPGETPKFDILLYYSTAFKIYQNKFNFDGDNSTTPVNHIYIHYPNVNGGANYFDSYIKYNEEIASSISSNSNTSKVTGITVDGLNPNLLILCNKFTNMGIDIWVKSGSSVRVEHENPTDLNAYNRFSAYSTNRERLRNNNGSSIQYTYDGNPASDYDPLTPLSVGVLRIDPILNEIPTCTINDCEGYLVKINVLTANNKKGVISLYPNPAKNIINITSNSIQMNLTRKVEIYNIEGKLVLIKYFSAFENEYSLDLSNFKSGLYVLKMTDANNQSYSQKFIVE